MSVCVVKPYLLLDSLLLTFSEPVVDSDLHLDQHFLYKETKTSSKLFYVFFFLFCFLFFLCIDILKRLKIYNFELTRINYVPESEGDHMMSL